MKICLAASGGGHLRQIQRLRPFYENHDAILVTQKTPLGVALSREMKTHFLPDIALGKIKRDPGEWGTYVRNLWNSTRILRQERPDLVISTGAGLTFNLLWLARRFSIRTAFIESIAHVYTPTATGRFMMNRADAYLAQWEDLHDRYPNSILACPIKPTERTIPDKDRVQTFVTVGTHGPFERLIDEVERLAVKGFIPRPLAIQHPGSKSISFADRSFESCTSQEFSNLLDESHLVIAHAGSGSIFSALEAGCKTIALPRLAAHGEHYDDHQKEILRKLTEMGAILGSERVEDLESLIEESKTFEPKSIEYDSTVIVDRIEELTNRWFLEE